jgi:hypothetical protein
MPIIGNAISPSVAPISGVADAAFNPVDISPEIWVNADNYAATVFADLSGNGNDMTLDSGTAVFTGGGQNGQNYIAAVDMYAVAASAVAVRPVYVYFVAEMPTSNNGCIGALESANNEIALAYSATPDDLAVSCGDGTFSQIHGRVVTPTKNNVFAIHQAQVTKGHLAVLRDGAYGSTLATDLIANQRDSLGDTLTYTPTLGKRTTKHFNGKFYECFFFNKALTPVEEDNLLTWINTKYSHSAALWSDGSTAVDVLALAGQSNAEGIGVNASLTVTYQGPQANVKINTGSALAALEEGVNNEGNTSANFGPEMTFGYRYNELNGNPVRLVKFGVSSLPLVEVVTLTWNPVYNPAARGQNHNYPFPKLIYDYHQSLFLMKNAGEIPTFRALLWVQGERDANGDHTSAPEAATYEAIFDAFYANFKIQFGVPEFDVALYYIHTDLPASPYTNKAAIRSALTSLATDSNKFLIDADDLTTTDNIHLDSDGYEQLGIRAANAL